MQKKNIRGGMVGLLLLGWAGLAQAQRLEATDVGQVLENQGASQFIVDAGNAIRATCLELGAAGPQTAERQDLFNRCREMSGTVLGLTGTTPPNGYGYSSPDDVFDAIRQFSGEEVSSQTRLATESTNRQFTNLGVRMDAIRRGARTTLSPVAFNFNGMDLGEGGLAANPGAPSGGTGASADRDADTGWAWFSNAAIGWGDRDQTSNESGYDFDSYGLTLGADYAFDNGLALGLALGYANYDVDLDRDPAGALVSSSAGGKIESDGYSLSGFFVHSLEDYYLSGILSYGRNDFDLVRLTSIAAAPGATGTAAGLTLDRRFDGSTDSSQLGGQFTGGRIFGSGATTLDLYAGLDYLDIDIDGFEEREANPSGGLALRYSDQDTQSVQSIVGVMLRHATSTGFGVLLPYAGVEWRREFDNESQALEYSYAFAQPGSTIGFRTPTDDPDENFFELTLGLSAQFANGLFGFVQYNSTAGLSDTSANVITVGLRGVF